MRKPNICKTSIRCNEGFAGESLERMIEKNLTEGTPIETSVSLIYTEKKEGVLPEHDPRTDMWEVALNGMGKVAAKQTADEKEQEETTETTEN